MNVNKDEVRNAYKTIFDLFTKNAKDTTEDDHTFRKKTTEEISKRDAEYSKLLQHFVKMTKLRNGLREFFKWLFYLLVISSTAVLTIIVYKLFDRIMSSADTEQILESLPLLITAMVGFVSTIIAIPVTITKYLFNTDEDKNITQIILHTQEHDTSGRQWAMDFKKLIQKIEQTSDKDKETMSRAQSGT